jgi:hypothetical protein
MRLLLVVVGAGLLASTVGAAVRQDFNGDRRSDIVWRHPDGSLFIWMMNGAQSVGATYLDPIGLNWKIEAFGDFNGDTKADILWRDAVTASTFIWIMDGARVIAGTGYTASQANEDWRIEAAGDLDGDGKADIVWRNVGPGPANGALFVWLMDGAGVRGGTYLDPISTNWQIEALSDFTGDQRADILWRETSSGATYLWVMAGASVVGGTGYTAAQTDHKWQIQDVGDLDGDGRSDIIWRQRTDGALFLWLMDGATVRGATYLDPIDTGWRIQFAGDFNGDGRADLLWREDSTANTYLWLMDGPRLIAGTGYTPPATAPWRIELSKGDPVINEFRNPRDSGLLRVKTAGAGGDVFDFMGPRDASGAPLAITEVVRREPDGTKSTVTLDALGRPATTYNENGLSLRFDWSDPANPTVVISQFGKADVRVPIGQPAPPGTASGRGLALHRQAQLQAASAAPLQLSVHDCGNPVSDARPKLLVLGSGSTPEYLSVGGSGGTYTFDLPTEPAAWGPGCRRMVEVGEAFCDLAEPAAYLLAPNCSTIALGAGLVLGPEVIPAVGWLCVTAAEVVEAGCSILTKSPIDLLLPDDFPPIDVPAPGPLSTSFFEMACPLGDSIDRYINEVTVQPVVRVGGEQIFGETYTLVRGQPFPALKPIDTFCGTYVGSFSAVSRNDPVACPGTIFGRTYTSVVISIGSRSGTGENHLDASGGSGYFDQRGCDPPGGYGEYTVSPSTAPVTVDGANVWSDPRYIAITVSGVVSNGAISGTAQMIRKAGWTGPIVLYKQP